MVSAKLNFTTFNKVKIKLVIHKNKILIFDNELSGINTKILGLKITKFCIPEKKFIVYQYC